MFSAFKKFGKLGALASSVARAWSPLALWPDGIDSPGMWIDPSLLSASFNDYTGTTLVATPGTVADASNPVGLALDIRAGDPVLGPELVTNGDFSAGMAGWTLAGYTTVGTPSGGSVRLSGIAPTTNFNMIANQIVAVTAGTTYRVTFPYSIAAGGVAIGLYAAGESGSFLGALYGGTQTIYVAAISTTLSLTIYAWNGASTDVPFDVTVGPATVKEVPGNHMLQSTSAARPLESARVNKFVGTELYANNAGNSNGWSGTVGAGTVTPNAMFVGSVALSQVTISASTGSKGAYNNVTSPAFPFVVSGFAKADGYRYLQIYGAGTGSFGGLVFDVVAGVFSQNTNSLETSVTAEGGGAFRFSVKSPGGVDSIGFGIIPQDTVTTVYGNQSWAGDGVSGMYLGGFSLVYGDQYTPYQSVPGNGSTYDATGITPFQLYDGVDDSMATATFLAGTLINGMDCMIAVRRDSGANCVAGLYNGVSDATKFFGMAESASGSGCVGSGAGTPTVWVDNTQLTGGTAVTRGTLHTALTAGSYHILEFRNLDLSAWTATGFGLYTSYVFPGARGDIMLFESTASTADKDAARQYLADYYGVTLP